MTKSIRENRFTDYIEDLVFWAIVVAYFITTSVMSSLYGSSGWIPALIFTGSLVAVSFIPQIINSLIKYKSWLSILQYAVAIASLIGLFAWNSLGNFQFLFRHDFLHYPICIILISVLIVAKGGRTIIEHVSQKQISPTQIESAKLTPSDE